MKMRNQTNRPANYERRTYMQKAVIANRRIRVGDISKVSERTGYSIGHVSDVIAGREINKRVMNHMFNMARGRKANASLV
jgi:hypothetical protein